MTVRIHPAWWSPRVFPYVLVLAGLAMLDMHLATRRYPHSFVFLTTVVLAIAGFLLFQVRKCRITLEADRIAFPEWRGEDGLELGVRLEARWHLGAEHPERITTLTASSIRDWVLDRGRIVLTSRDGTRHRIGVLGLRARDRARIVAWLTEKVGG